MDPLKLTPQQLDAIGEVGSIGAGHAATALSQLLGRAVDIDVPVVRMLPVDEVPTVFGGPENLVGAVYSQMLGDISGGLLFMVPRRDLLLLADLLRAREPGSAKSLGADEEGQVTHAASVLQAAYTAAIARLTGLSVLPSPAHFAFDMMGAILEVISAGIGLKADNALLIMTRFVTEGVTVDAALFYLPDPDSLDVLLGKLGIA
jgi:chemotaxis protein CheC